MFTSYCPGFINRFRDLGSFTDTHADVPGFVTGNDESTESHSFAALDYLCHPVDKY
jgi:hypothetical protein